jgi:DNA adenine methylase
MARRSSNLVRPRPFLKWAGGKRSLLSHIEPRLPRKKIELYIEPFVGGGAVFLALARQGRVKRVILGDRNPELVNAWTFVRDAPGDLIKAVLDYGEASSENYYRVRALSPESGLERAARLLWLNRTCFNGLYRLNRKGQFNVPFGRHDSIRLVDPENIHAVSRALHETNAEIRQGDFAALMLGEATERSTTVYCDPPYMPVSKTAKFTAYDRLPFGIEEHTRLADAVVELRHRKVKVLLSNSWTPETRRLYRARRLNAIVVGVPRPINRDATKRGKVPEFLVGANVRLRGANLPTPEVL